VLQAIQIDPAPIVCCGTFVTDAIAYKLGRCGLPYTVFHGRFRRKAVTTVVLVLLARKMVAGRIIAEPIPYELPIAAVAFAIEYLVPAASCFGSWLRLRLRLWNRSAAKAAGAIAEVRAGACRAEVRPARVDPRHQQLPTALATVSVWAAVVTAWVDGADVHWRQRLLGVWWWRRLIAWSCWRRWCWSRARCAQVAHLITESSVLARFCAAEVCAALQSSCNESTALVVAALSFIRVDTRYRRRWRWCRSRARCTQVAHLITEPFVLARFCVAEVCAALQSSCNESTALVVAALSFIRVDACCLCGGHIRVPDQGAA
jgi:hypothetical protein